MTRLIDADELLKELEEWEADLYDTSPGRQLGITDAIVIACQMPTVDAVQVIRCKDCKYKETGGWQTWCCQNQFWVTDGDFCSRAEEKDNG